MSLLKSKKKDEIQPELMGTYEVAAFLGIKAQNLSGKSIPRGLPEPVASLRATRVWYAADIRRFAKDHGYPRDYAVG